MIQSPDIRTDTGGPVILRGYSPATVERLQTTLTRLNGVLNSIQVEVQSLEREISSIAGRQRRNSIFSYTLDFLKRDERITVQINGVLRITGATDTVRFSMPGAVFKTVPASARAIDGLGTLIEVNSPTIRYDRWPNNAIKTKEATAVFGDYDSDVADSLLKKLEELERLLISVHP